VAQARRLEQRLNFHGGEHAGLAAPYLTSALTCRADRRRICWTTEDSLRHRERNEETKTREWSGERRTLGSGVVVKTATVN